MNSRITFQSLHYKKIHGVEILTKIFTNGLTTDPIILSNQQWLLIPESCFFDKITCLTPTELGVLDAKKITLVKHYFINESKIIVAKFSNQLIEIKNKTTNLYLEMCNKLCKESLECAQQILQYTYDHLNTRIAENIKLTQHEAIKLSLATVVCHLEAAEKLLASIPSLFLFFSVMEYILNALHLLAELGGGRVMLRGNAIELMFYLRLFQSIYFKSGERT